MKKTPAAHLLVLALLPSLSVILVVGYIFVFGQIMDKNKNVSSMLNDAEVQNSVNNGQQSLQDILANTKDDRDKIGAIVLSDDKVVNFIEAVEALGDVTHTHVTTSSVNVNEGGAANTGLLTMQVTVGGAWQNIMQFTSLIENMPYKISINAMDVKVGNANADTSVDTTTTKDKKPAVVVRSAPQWQANLTINVVKNKK